MERSTHLPGIKQLNKLLLYTVHALCAYWGGVVYAWSAPCLPVMNWLHKYCFDVSICQPELKNAVTLMTAWLEWAYNWRFDSIRNLHMFLYTPSSVWSGLEAKRVQQLVAQQRHNTHDESISVHKASAKCATAVDRQVKRIPYLTCIYVNKH